MFTLYCTVYELCQRGCPLRSHSIYLHNLHTTNLVQDRIIHLGYKLLGEKLEWEWPPLGNLWIGGLQNNFRLTN